MRWCTWSTNMASYVARADMEAFFCFVLFRKLAMWGPIGGTFPSNCAPSKDTLPNQGGWDQLLRNSKTLRLPTLSKRRSWASRCGLLILMGAGLLADVKAPELFCLVAWVHHGLGCAIVEVLGLNMCVLCVGDCVATSGCTCNCYARGA